MGLRGSLRPAWSALEVFLTIYMCVYMYTYAYIHTYMHVRTHKHRAYVDPGYEMSGLTVLHTGGLTGPSRSASGGAAALQTAGFLGSQGVPAAAAVPPSELAAPLAS